MRSGILLNTNVLQVSNLEVQDLTARQQNLYANAPHAIKHTLNAITRLRRRHDPLPNSGPQFGNTVTYQGAVLKILSCHAYRLESDGAFL